MTYSDIKTALLTVIDKVYHHAPPQNVSGNYIIWAEDGDIGLWAEGRLAEPIISGKAFYYTKDEYDGNVSKIQNVFVGSAATISLIGVEHNEDTGYIEYEFRFAAMK